MKRRNGLEEDDDSAKLCGIPGVLVPYWYTLAQSTDWIQSSILAK